MRRNGYNNTMVMEIPYTEAPSRGPFNAISLESPTNGNGDSSEPFTSITVQHYEE